MTGTAFRKLGGSEDKGVGQRLRDMALRAVKPFVAAAALSLCSFEPVYEPPRRKTKILFKPGEREALEVNTVVTSVESGRESGGRDTFGVPARGEGIPCGVGRTRARSVPAAV